MATYVVIIPVDNPVRTTHPQCIRTIETEGNHAKAVELGIAKVISEGFFVTVSNPDDQYSMEAFAKLVGEDKRWPIEFDIHQWARENNINLPCEADSGYCVSSRDAGHKAYWHWEDEIANPALEMAGFKLTWCWVDAERDSIGPLSRQITATKDNLFYEFSYG